MTKKLIDKDEDILQASLAVKAIALIFSILVSTLLALVVIPVLYYATLYKEFQ